MPNQPNRKDECPENCQHDCPTGLLNWPPSKGPKPFCRRCRIDIQYFEPEREDAERPPRAPLEVVHIVEKEAISTEEFVSKSKMPPRFKLPSPEERKKRKAARDKKGFEAKQIFSVNHHIETVATLTVDQARKLLNALCQETGCLSSYIDPPREIEVIIDYPMSLNVKLKIKPYEINGKRKSMTIGYILWVIAKEYERIYAEHEKYGVWGHAMSDLCFERLSIERNEGCLYVGS